MEQLVHDKVENFWRVIQADSTRRGKVRHEPCGGLVFMFIHLMHQITVTFSEKRPKKSWYQLYSADEHVPWEQWYDQTFSYQAQALQRPDSRIINVEFRQHRSERGAFPQPSFILRVTYTCIPDRLSFNTNLKNTLAKSIQMILVHTSSERGRAAVPPMTQSNGISPFPFKIAAHVGGIEIKSIWPPMATTSTNIIPRVQ